MRLRWTLITNSGDPEQMYPWTILPPKFIDLLDQTPNHEALPFAIGIKEHYPPLWDVDTVTLIDYTKWLCS